MKNRRIIRKDEYVGVRMPRSDKNLLEIAVRLESRDTSDLERLAAKHPSMRQLANQ